MRTITFQSVVDGILRRHGLDPVGPGIDHDTARALAGHINRRVKYGWRYWDWPQLSHTEERAFRTIWNSTRQFKRVNADGKPDEVFYIPNTSYYQVLATAPSDPSIGTLPTNTTYWQALTPVDTYISLDQTCRFTIGEVLGVYDTNPRVDSDPPARGLSFEPSEFGIDVWRAPGPTVFVYYRLPSSKFTALSWISGKTYNRTDRVLWVDGNVYRCLATTSSALPSDTNFWTLEPFPEFLQPFVEAGAFADSLREMGNGAEPAVKQQLRQEADAEAATYLEQEVDVLQAQGQRHKYNLFSRRWYRNNLCVSQPWTGIAVTTLTDVCQTDYMYPSPPPGNVDAGVTALVNGQSWIDVTFVTAKADANWRFTELVVVNTVDATPLNIYATMMTSKTATGFRMQLNAQPNSVNYFLHWAIRT